MKYFKFDISLINFLLGVTTLALLVFPVTDYYIESKFAKETKQISLEISNIKHHAFSPAKHPRYLNLPILTYHHIGELPKKASKMRKLLTVSTENFKTQMLYLKEMGFVSISAKNLFDYSQGKASLPKKSILITFDDGYQDTFTNAVPILENNDLIGNFAIITDYPDKLLDENFYASWNQIKAAKDAGHEILSHSRDHFNPNKKGITSEYILKNLKDSLLKLNEKTGGDITPALVYPYGEYDNTYIEAAKQAGFTMGFTVRWGKTIDTENLMEIPRNNVAGYHTMKEFMRLVE